MGTVSEDMDTTIDSSIILKYVPGTSDATTQVPVIKKRSVHISVQMKGRDKGKISHSYCMIIKTLNMYVILICRNTDRHQLCQPKQCCSTM